MAVEKLNTLLEQLLTEVPDNHPDRYYIETLRARNSNYAASAIRASRIYDYEGREIKAKSEEERRILLDSVLPVVSDVFDIPSEEIIGKSRLKEVVRARFAVSYLFTSIVDLGPSEIARMLGGKDHTTVINHVKKARQLIKEDELFSDSISEAEDRLRQLITPNPKIPQFGNITNGHR